MKEALRQTQEKGYTDEWGHQSGRLDSGNNNQNSQSLPLLPSAHKVQGPNPALCSPERTFRRMATSNIRSTRKLKQWMIDNVDSGKFNGLIWDDPDKTRFRIPWKHAGKHDFRPDEDAALFKEWAIFKNKYKNGAKLEAAVWKTRLRCALNKSPEFAETPEHSQLDISEPYKVYRLVPPEEQNGKQVASSSRKRTLKEEDRIVSSEDEMEPKKRSRSNHITKEVKDEGKSRASSLFYPDDSGIGSSSDSPQRTTESPLRCVGSPYENFDSLARSSEIPDYSHEIILTLPVVEANETPALQEAGINPMRVTIYYSGQQVFQKDIQTNNCKISSSASKLGKLCYGMEHICLPPADAITDVEKRHITQNLLTFLDKGIMLASYEPGIYVQRSCRGRVFWTGPCSPQPGGCNLLNQGDFVQLFDAKQFHTELELYQNRQGLPPKYQVTLCFGEEISENDQKENKLIIVQVEQKLAQQQVLQDVPENMTNTIFFTDPVVNSLSVKPQLRRVCYISYESVKEDSWDRLNNSDVHALFSQSPHGATVCFVEESDSNC